jgi:hypothetical protein
LDRVPIEDFARPEVHEGNSDYHTMIIR